VDYLGESGIAHVAIGAPLGFAAPYPYHLANCGDFDICGFKRPQSYYRDILWGVRTAPYIGVLDPQLYGKTIRFSEWGWEPVLDSWTYPGWEGKPTRVDVYSADEEVELLINGTSVGRKPAGAAQQNKATFEVTYQPGTLVAVGFMGGVEQGRTELTTAGPPVALRLTPGPDNHWRGSREPELCHGGDRGRTRRARPTCHRRGLLRDHRAGRTYRGGDGQPGLGGIVCGHAAQGISGTADGGRAQQWAGRSDPLDRHGQRARHGRNEGVSSHTVQLSCCE
jgi:hypothetical protein